MHGLWCAYSSLAVGFQTMLLFKINQMIVSTTFYSVVYNYIVDISSLPMRMTTYSVSWMTMKKMK